MLDNLTTQQRGKCGELFVQYILLKYGIESAPLTTDTGIDLVAYPRTATGSWLAGKPATIQVKTSTHRGDTGGMWIEWNLSEDCPADCVATVDIERNKLWLFKFADFKGVAKRAGRGQLRLWWVLPECASKKDRRHENDFTKYEIDTEGNVPEAILGFV